MKKIKIFVLPILILIYFSPYLLNTTLATNSTQTPTATPSSDVKSKLKALQDEIASKAASIKQEVTKKLQNKAFVGIVKSKSDTGITLATTSGSKIIMVTQDTVYSSTKGKLSFKNIDPEDHLVALGDIDDTDVLHAKKVIEVTNKESAEIIPIWGIVTSVSGQTFSINTKDNKNISITPNSKTIFKFGNNDSSVSDIKVNKAVIVLDNRFVYILPYSANVKPKVASPSATLTPSPTSKVTPTPTEQSSRATPTKKLSPTPTPKS